MEILPVSDLVPGTRRHSWSAWLGPRWVHEQGVTLGQGGLVGRGSWWTMAVRSVRLGCPLSLETSFRVPGDSGTLTRCWQHFSAQLGK